LKSNKSKYYVVWQGVTPGVYSTWAACKQQIDGFPEAKYKSFATEEAANEAYNSPYWTSLSPALSKGEGAGVRKQSPSFGGGRGGFIQESLAVDAACSGNPGKMEYRGVYVPTGKEVFRMSFDLGTNNIGEFLALVHGLALLKQKRLTMPVYSDSVNAILWVNAKKCKTKLEKTAKTADLFDMIARAEKWLRENAYETTILKWETKVWGEIPADFGRK
jgi:ribonuclease HI